MKINLSVRDLKSLRTALEKDSGIQPLDFDKIVEALVTKSDERKQQSQERSISRMPASKYYSYFVRFGEIYKEMVGANYFPGIRDMNYIRNVVLTLNEKNLGFDDYVKWVARIYRFQIKKLGTLALRKYINEYLVNRSKSSL